MARGAGVKVGTLVDTVSTVSVGGVVGKVVVIGWTVTDVVIGVEEVAFVSEVAVGSLLDSISSKIFGLIKMNAASMITIDKTGITNSIGNLASAGLRTSNLVLHSRQKLASSRFVRPQFGQSIRNPLINCVNLYV